MKKKLVITFVTVVVLFVAYKQFKGTVAHWIYDNFVPHATLYPAADSPDQVCLTISGDPKTSVAVQWRASMAVTDGVVEYRANGSETQAQIQAQRSTIADDLVKNDPRNARFSAVLSGLQPGTEYEYRVGSMAANKWSDWAEFTTAPTSSQKFSFVYWGDPQVGLDYWGQLVRNSYEHAPNAAFHLIAGDLVDNGGYRNQWDDFFSAGKGVFDQQPLAPALGNHDYAKHHEPQMFLDLFTLPQNGPPGFPAERAYSFEYSNALFVVLDSNTHIDGQAQWLEERLSSSNATWKFALYHHPAYSLKEHRDNPEVRKYWGTLFDEYHLDIAFEGHDHAYVRTHPMKNGAIAASPAEGTVYVMTVAGTKYYEQLDSEFAATSFEEVSTYQIIDITTDPDRLVYRAYDFDGTVRDEFTIEKTASTANN